jgi:pre-60S factor REI1
MIEVHEPQTNYYCPTCLERFENIDQHKIHYKSDFHRYNLKRKTVKLAPVTLQQFSTKIVETKNENTSELICNECK